MILFFVKIFSSNVNGILGETRRSSCLHRWVSFSLQADVLAMVDLVFLHKLRLFQSQADTEVIDEGLWKSVKQCLSLFVHFPLSLFLKIYQIGWKYIENFSRHETTYGFPWGVGQPYELTYEPCLFIVMSQSSVINKVSPLTSTFHSLLKRLKVQGHSQCDCQIIVSL